MRKIIISSFIGVISIASFTANSAENKTGIYITGKMGASIAQMSGQKVTGTPYEKTEEKASFNMGRHSTGVFSGGIALGYNFLNDFNLPIRAELDFTTRGKANSKYDLEREVDEYGSYTTDAKNQIRLTTLMINAFYDFKNQSSFTPYISAGLGYARINHKTILSSSYSDYFNPESSISGSDSRSHKANNLAWSVGAGIKYIVSENFDVDFSYKYLDAGKSKFSYDYSGYSRNESKVKIKTNDLMLGVTYNF